MIFIVCGQAAGGTSMTMRVLIEGGIEGNFRDDSQAEQRLYVLNNPYGTFEGKDLNQLENRVSKFLSVKEIKNQCGDRPTKIIHINRDPQEIFNSRQRRKQRIAEIHKRELNGDFGTLDGVTKINKKKKEELEKLPVNFEVLNLEFEDMLKNTDEEIEKIAAFVHPAPFDKERAVLAVDRNI